MIAVSDTSPLILLDKAEHLWILGNLFKKVIISPSVDKEWLRPGSYVVPEWLTVSPLSKKAKSIAEKLYKELDKGEAEAIALFKTIKADWLLIDDLKGRRHAKSLGLPVVGTAGLLITAKKRGIIPEIKPIFNALKKHRYYLSDDVLEKAIALSDEN
jgi:predicted nucleic acid-binding protein